MKTLKYTILAVFSALILLSGANPAGSKSLLPKGLIMESKYAKGPGSPVGVVQLVKGNVIIIHANKKNYAYTAKKGLSLYKGDTIITLKRGRIRLKLKDKSLMTLASGTRLVINRSVYNPSQKRRSSFVGLSVGKVRFMIRKVVGYKRSEFKVKTPTAILGVRGSDFIVKVTESRTEVITLKDTLLSVVSLSNLEEEVLLEDFERTVIDEHTLPSETTKVTEEEVMEIFRDMEIDSGGGFETGEILDEQVVKKENGGQKDSGSKEDEARSGQEGEHEGGEREEGEHTAGEHEGDEHEGGEHEGDEYEGGENDPLGMNPDQAMPEGEKPSEPLVPDNIGERPEPVDTSTEEIDNITNQVEDVNEDVKEDVADEYKELPALPDPPPND